MSVFLNFCFYCFGKRAQIYILKTTEKTKKITKNAKNEKKVAIAYRKHFKLENRFFKIFDDPLLNFCSKKKTGFDIFFFIFTFLCRLLIQRNPKIRLQASIQTIFRHQPFSFDSYMNQKRKVRDAKGFKMPACTQIFRLSCINNREKNL